MPEDIIRPDDRGESHVPPTTSSQEIPGTEDPDTDSKIEALDAVAQVDKIRNSVNFLQKMFDESSKLTTQDKADIEGTIELLQRRLEAASDISSRLGHEIGVAEAVEMHGPGVIVPPVDDDILPKPGTEPAEPYKHAGKTTEEFRADIKQEQHNFRSETAGEELQAYADLRNALTDEQAEDFHKLLGRPIRREGSMSLAELQALRDVLTQQQLEQFGDFLDKKIGDLNYEKEKAENIASGRSARIGGPQGEPDIKHFPSVTDTPDEPESPIG